MKARRRFLHPLWLIVSLPGYIGLRLLPSLSGRPVEMLLGAVLLIAACIVVPLSVNTRALENRKWADALAWVGLLAMGFFSSLFIITLLRDIVLLVAYVALPQSQTAGLSIATARWTVIITVVCTYAGFIIARRPRTVVVDIPIANLPDALQGFSIAQITDLHVGPTIKRGFVERIVSRVNDLGADVIAITGDLVDGTVHDLAAHTAPLAGLHARYGVFFVNGNHEYYSGERAWTDEVRRLGITVLKNQHVMLERNGAPLLLAGVTDYTAHHFDPSERSDPRAALLGAPAVSGPKILLAHQPSTADAAADAGFDLQISGHTHGGQFWPWNFFVRFFQPFTSGLNNLRNLRVYVSTGTGYWGPPNRFIVPGEITKIAWFGPDPIPSVVVRRAKVSVAYRHCGLISSQ